MANVSLEETVTSVIMPVLSKNEVDLYDCYVARDVIKIFLTKTSGISFEQIQNCNREISGALESSDPQILEKYELEVSSPGLERVLRRKEHFCDSVGSSVSIKTTNDSGLPRRIQGNLLSANDSNCTLNLGSNEITVDYKFIQSASTVFIWEEEMSNKSKKGETRLKNRQSDASKKVGK